jgi:hypothetical protein
MWHNTSTCAYYKRRIPDGTGDLEDHILMLSTLSAGMERMAPREGGRTGILASGV